MFVVVGGGGPPLLGRNFLRIFDFGIEKFENRLHHLSLQSSQCLDTELNKLLVEYKNLFSEGLGKFHVGKISVEVQENTKPVFLRLGPFHSNGEN